MRRPRKKTERIQRTMGSRHEETKTMDMEAKRRLSVSRVVVVGRLCWTNPPSTAWMMVQRAQDQNQNRRTGRKSRRTSRTSRPSHLARSAPPPLPPSQPSPLRSQRVPSSKLTPPLRSQTTSAPSTSTPFPPPRTTRALARPTCASASWAACPTISPTPSDGSASNYKLPL
ncbi:uncharacterized protein MYCGRDRAFT_64849 [Zymoseptoria tritici IPO323]|uniref:Uncharacterized protein n=1 Tax=Zymoseptoria tritici (strain CBS 115943 / IPO323) TaxID=336722 RepID=F9XRJ8_ZYMTI|nr:uncharacterized protein MYCGRDRAFT_64849 [Zymoseptoria tritici IPO323]EGP82153.1 hypothetical protein MYCGRDRAFT_64849 [Zymoseptoria tritici IPO323]